jgi:tetratricopeptide (TPR) repeat protein
MVDHDPASGRWRLHDLVRDLAGGYLESAGAWEATMWRYAEACLRIAEETQRQYLSGGDEVLRALERFDAERPHLDAARQWAAAHSGTGPGDRWLVACSVATNKTGFLRYDLRHEIMPQTCGALEAARRLGDRQSEGVILNQLGHLHINLGELDQATGFHQQQLALVRSCGDQAGEVRALNGLAIAYTQLGHLRQAIETNEKQLCLVRTMSNPRGEAMARCNLGLAHLHLGEPERALSYLEPALAAVRELGDQYGESVILSNIGVAHLAAGDARRAAQDGESALSLIRAMGDKFLEAEVLSDVCAAMVALHQAEAGIRHGGRALAIAREIHAHQLEAKALLALGQAHAAAGDVRHARTWFEEASAILQTIGDHHGQAECRWHLGLSLIDEQPAHALGLLRAAVSYHQEIGHALAAKHAATLDRLEAVLVGSLNPAACRTARRSVASDFGCSCRHSQAGGTPGCCCLLPHPQ